MKLAAITYHKNAYARYNAAWLKAFSRSVSAQTIPVELFEMDYGGGATRLLEKVNWLSSDLGTHVDAQNFLLDYVFSLTAGFDAVLNTNVDDVYSPSYAEVSERSLLGGAHVASSNFTLTHPNGEVYHRHEGFHLVDVAAELRKGHNVIAHPTVVYSREFWEGCSRYDPTEIPHEDLSLWQREVDRFRFVIAPEHLVAHRVHNKSVCAEEAAKVR